MLIFIFLFFPQHLFYFRLFNIYLCFTRFESLIRMKFIISIKIQKFTGLFVFLLSTLCNELYLMSVNQGLIRAIVMFNPRLRYGTSLTPIFFTYFDVIYASGIVMNKHFYILYVSSTGSSKASLFHMVR